MNRVRRWAALPLRIASDVAYEAALLVESVHLLVAGEVDR